MGDRRGCTLRAAIEEANALAGSDQIILPSRTDAYVLTIPTELTVTSHLTITGGGASTTIIDGNRNVRPNSRVSTIVSSFLEITSRVSISGVTIRNGGIIDGRRGGGIIIVGGVLTVTNSTVSGNAASGVSSSFPYGPYGGGISNIAGFVTMINSTVSGNTNQGIGGGGIFNAGEMTLINSTVAATALL